MADFDIVSDLNDGSNEIVPAHGSDTQDVNAPVREPASQPKKVGEPKAEGDRPMSLRDQISSALKGQEDTPPAGQQDGGDQPRGPDGKFLPKADANADPANPAPQPDPANPAPAAPVTAAPAGIDPQVFASLPAETQAQLARTMEDVTNQQKRFASLAPVEQLIAPRIDAWALNGMAPAQALHQLLALSDFAGRDPGGFIKYIAQNNGVDLEELVLEMVPDEEADPRIAALQAEIAELKGTVQGQTQQQQQAIHQRTVDEVVAFAGEKGQDGNLLRPHLPELGDSWHPYIGLVKAQNPSWSHAQVLQQAYENACWNNASVRGKLQAAANAAAEAERLRKETERVSAARTAAVTLPSGAPTSAPLAPNDANRTLRDTIRASMAAASST